MALAEGDLETEQQPLAEERARWDVRHALGSARFQRRKI